MRVLISGCGYVGIALGLLLAAEGHTVYGLRRNPRKLPPPIRPVRADLAEPLPPGALPERLAAVVLAASPDGASDAAYKAAYVTGPRNLLAALEPRRDTPRRVVLVSSTGVYAQRGGEWVDEDSATEPETASGKRLLEGERLVLGGPHPATILRLGGIYGPGREGAVRRALHDDAPSPEPDEPPRYTNRIHRDDCAGALRHLILHPSPALLYLGVDHDPAPQSTVSAWLAHYLGQDPLPPPESPTDAGRRTRSNKRCSNRRLVASGYDFRYPTFREGFPSLLDDPDLNLTK